MTQALGLIETKGLVGLIEASDAMCKAANVQLVRHASRSAAATSPRSCAATPAACARRSTPGAAAAKAVGELVASHVIPRPHDGLVEGMLR